VLYLLQYEQVPLVNAWYKHVKGQYQGTVSDWNGAGMHGTARLTGGRGQWERERRYNKVVQLIYVIFRVYVCLCQCNSEVANVFRKEEGRRSIYWIRTLTGKATVVSIP
jgi:hypothetical protein